MVAETLWLQKRLLNLPDFNWQKVYQSSMPISLPCLYLGLTLLSALPDEMQGFADWRLGNESSVCRINGLRGAEFGECNAN